MKHETLIDWLKSNDLYNREDFGLIHMRRLWNYWQYQAWEHESAMHKLAGNAFELEIALKKALAREEDKDKELAEPNRPLNAYIQKVRANANTGTIFEAGTVMTQSWMEQGGFLGAHGRFNTKDAELCAKIEYLEKKLELCKQYVPEEDWKRIDGFIYSEDNR